LTGETLEQSFATVVDKQNFTQIDPRAFLRVAGIIP